MLDSCLPVKIRSVDGAATVKTLDPNLASLKGNIWRLHRQSIVYNIYFKTVYTKLSFIRETNLLVCVLAIY